MSCHKCTLSSTLFLVASLGLATSATAQPVFKLEALPELPGGASQPRAIAAEIEGTPGSSKRVAGRSSDSGGLWKAVVWEQGSGGSWSILALPVADPAQASVANGIDCACDATGCECYAAGSMGDPGSEQPVIWSDTTGSWVRQTVLLPGGFIGGAAYKVKFKAGVDLANKVKISGGGTDSGGTPKAIVWARDASGDWQPTLLPELSSMGGAESQASSVIELVDMVLHATGTAGDDSGNAQPVVWRCDSGADDCTLTASWTVTQLPLLAGGAQGEAMAMNKAELIEAIAGRSETGGGGTTVTHAVLWMCDGNSMDCTAGASWTVTDLGSLPGLDDSQASGLSACSDCGTGMFRILGKAIAPPDPDADVAALWEVDTSVTPPTVSVFDLNSLVPDLPSDVALQAAKGTIRTKPPRPGAVEQIELAVEGIKRTGSGRASTTAANDPHAFVLTEIVQPIPTVSEWGLIVMTLLILTAGTLVYARRRAIHA